MITQHLLTFPGIGRLRSVCHLLVDGQQRWVVAGQLEDNPGTSVTNAIERIHHAVSTQWFGGETDFLLFEYTPRDLIDHTPTLYEIRWHGPSFTMPEWTRTERADHLLRELSPRFPVPYSSRSLADAQHVVVGDVVSEPASPVSRSLLIGTLPLPADFPAKEFDSAELHFRARTGMSPVDPAPTWLEFSGAWTAVAYRFVDVATYDKQFRESLKRYGTAPPLPERYAQESILFAFFIAGLAAIESFSYGISALAWEAGVDEFSLDSPPAKNVVSPQITVERLRRHFPDEAITLNLSELIASEDFLGWVETRNALAHRAAPPRHHTVTMEYGADVGDHRTSNWGPYNLDDRLTADRRRWLADVLQRLLRDAGDFAARRFAHSSK
jgi:hypothetical protein